MGEKNTKVKVLLWPYAYGKVTELNYLEILGKPAACNDSKSIYMMLEPTDFDGADYQQQQPGILGGRK